MKTYLAWIGFAVSLLIAEQAGEFIAHNRFQRKIKSNKPLAKINPEMAAVVTAWMNDASDTRSFDQIVKHLTSEYFIQE